VIPKKKILKWRKLPNNENIDAWYTFEAATVSLKAYDSTSRRILSNMPKMPNTLASAAVTAV
jgi:hypothetical protein